MERIFLRFATGSGTYRRVSNLRLSAVFTAIYYKKPSGYIARYVFRGLFKNKNKEKPVYYSG